MGQIMACAHAHAITHGLYALQREYTGVPCALGALRQRGAGDRDVQASIQCELALATSHARSVVEQVRSGRLRVVHGRFACTSREGHTAYAFGFRTATFSQAKQPQEHSLEHGLQTMAAAYRGFSAFDHTSHVRRFVLYLTSTPSVLHTHILLVLGMAWTMTLKTSCGAEFKIGRHF